MPTIRIGHSPDPDDAFMWYPLADFPNGTGPGGRTYTPRIDTRGYRFVHVLEDIQTLNDRCQSGDPARMLEITALSIHQYPFVADRYALTSCGSSMGDNYGPMLVAGKDCRFEIDDLRLKGISAPGACSSDRKSAISNLQSPPIAVPGERTSAFLALSLLLGKGNFAYRVVPFDRIIPAVAAGEFAAGLIIHEGQLTYAQAGLTCLADLGRWWTQHSGLPMPLGGNAIRRDLGPAAMREICGVLLASIHYALDHRDEAVAYALNYARDMGQELADRFVGMYVNHWTLDYGPRGRTAVNEFLRQGAAAGLVPEVGEVDFVEPG